MEFPLDNWGNSPNNGTELSLGNVYMSFKEELLSALSKYCEATGKAASGVGLTVFNDHKFFSRLQEGGSCTLRSYEKAMEWLTQNTPHKKANRINGSKRQA